MKRCVFLYQTSDGRFAERAILEWAPSAWPDAIEAYCELRQEQRTFKIRQMSQIVDSETGEVIANPWLYFGLAEVPNASQFPSATVEEKKDSNHESLDSRAWEALPAIRALKFFALSTRMLAGKYRRLERLRLVQFVTEVCDVESYSKEEIDAWLQKLWCADLRRYLDGDTSEYESLLRGIPAKLLARCRDYALWIARGSGRKALNPEWAQRAESEFSENPYVQKLELNYDTSAINTELR